MLYAPIVPIPMLPMIEDYDYHMVLAHLLHNYDYYKFYKEHDGHKILDNGAAEGTLMSTDELLEWAALLEVSEVVCPDALGEMYATSALMDIFMARVPKHFGVMIPLQCQTWDEFDKIFHRAMEWHPRSVALPRIMTTFLGPKARLEAAIRIRVVFASNVPIHALGCTDDLAEATALAYQGIVRGLDTAEPVVRALEGLNLRSSPVRRQANYFHLQPDVNVKELVEVNLDVFRTTLAQAPVSEVRGVQP